MILDTCKRINSNNVIQHLMRRKRINVLYIAHFNKSSQSPFKLGNILPILQSRKWKLRKIVYITYSAQVTRKIWPQYAGSFNHSVLKFRLNLKMMKFYHMVYGILVTVIVHQGPFCPPTEIWQCLETFLDVVTGKYCWHLMFTGKGCCTMHKTDPHLTSK